MLNRTRLRHDTLNRLRGSKVRNVIVSDTSPLGHDPGSDEITTNVDHRAEAVDEPVDSDDDGVHARDGNADRLSDDERENQGRTGNRRCGD